VMCLIDRKEQVPSYPRLSMEFEIVAVTFQSGVSLLFN